MVKSLERVLAIGTLALCVGACAQPAPPARQPAAQDVSAAPSRPIEEADLARRLAALAHGVRRPGDITVAHVEALLDTKLDALPERGAFGAKGVLSSGIAYAVRVSPSAYGEGLGFHWVVIPAADGLARCVVKLETFAAALEGAGYIRRPRLGQPVRGDVLSFDRERAWVTTFFSSPSGSPDGAACVVAFDLYTRDEEGRWIAKFSSCSTAWTGQAPWPDRVLTRSSLL